MENLKEGYYSIETQIKKELNKLDKTTLLKLAGVDTDKYYNKHQLIKLAYKNIITRPIPPQVLDIQEEELEEFKNIQKLPIIKRPTAPKILDLPEEIELQEFNVKKLKKLKRPTAPQVLEPKIRFQEEIKEEEKETIEILNYFKYTLTKRFKNKNLKTLEEFFNYVNKNRDTKYDNKTFNAQLVRIYFKPLESNKYIARFIQSTDFDDIRNLKQFFIDINHDPEKGGSDGVDTDIYEPIFFVFDIIYNRLHGYAKETKIMNFIKEEFTPSAKNCGLQVLKHIGDKITEEEYQKKELFILSNMIKHIKETDIKINIISSYIKYDGGLKSNEDFEDVEINKRFNKMYQVKNNEIMYNVIYDCNEKPLYNIIYSAENFHYSLCKKIELDNIYINSRYEFYKKKIHMTNAEIGHTEYILMNNIKQHNENLIKNELISKPKIDTEYIFFDYETVADFNNESINKPYSLSLFHANIEILERLNKLEERHTEEGATEEIKKELELIKNNYTMFFNGFDCSKQFLNYIRKTGYNKKFYLVGFNSANFDNFILYSDLLKLEKFEIDNLGDPMIANGQLLNFVLDGRHELLDLRKHIGGSLINNCKSYNVNLCSKKTDLISHYEMQKKFNNNELLDFIKDNEELKEYNIFDCLSLGLLFYKYRTAISNIKGFEEYKIEEFMTLGQMVYKNLEEYLTKNEIKMPKYTDKKKKTKKNKEEVEGKNERLLTYFKDIAKNRIAGRVQLFNKRQLITDKMASIDVCSLYPYIMAVAPNYYTAGEIVEVDNYKKKPKDLIGYFYCDIDQTPLTVKIMAGKTKEGNNWEENNFNNVFISSIMIDYLIKCKAKVNIKNGIYYTEKIKGCHMFKPILEVMKLKNAEDEKKENKQPYNPALRETYKLIMNIISGKINQKMNREERKILNSVEFAELLENKKITEINTIIMVGEKAHVSYKKSEEDCIKNVKPISNGALIYDYAKIYMHEKAYTKTEYKNLIYTDTDSNKLRYNDFIEWSKYAENSPVPHWEEVEEFDERYKNHTLYNEKSKVFGSFENEYKKDNYTLSYFEQKKVYLCIDKENPKNASFHFKGVSKNDMILPEDYKKTNNNELSILFNEGEYPRIKDNYIKFFDTIHNEKKIKLLSFSIQKISNNTKKNVLYNEENRTNKKCYNVITSYRIKNININD